MLKAGMLETKRAKLMLALVATLLLALAALALDASPAFASGTVTVSVQGKGDVTGDGVNCNESGGPDCSEFYANTQVCEDVCFFEPPYVEFTAGPDRNGYVYNGWSGCETVTGRVCGLTVHTSTGLTAIFRDAQVPSVSTLSPNSGVQRGTITLSASASDNSGAVQRVEFRIRGSLVATDTTAPYSTSFNTASVADGPASLRATAFDAAGNSSSLESSFTIDNTPPTLTVNSGPNGETYGPGTTQTWTFTPGDATSGVAAVQCSVVPAGSAASFGSCSGGFTSHSVSNKPEGAYTFTVRARDNGGLETTAAPRSFSIDATAPNTQIDSGIADGGVTNQTSLTFNFSASEPGSTFECRVYPAALTPPAFEACSGTGSHTASAFSAGTYAFEVRATDPYGNRDSSPAKRTFTIDTTAPTVESWSPKGKKVKPTAKPTVTFSEKMNEASVEASTNGKPVNFVLKKGSTVIPATVVYTEDGTTFKAVLTPARKLKKGAKYTATVTTGAKDEAGNAAVVKSWRFTVKR